MAIMSRRIKGKDQLKPGKGERVLCVARLIAQVQNIVVEPGNPQGFDAAVWMARWLNEPLPALSGARPLDLLDTMDGQARFSNTLAQIQSGAYS